MCDHYNEEDCPYCGIGFEGFSVEKHDAKIRADAIEKCAEIISKSMRCESCPADCLWGTEQKCKDTLALYLKTQIEEQKND